MPKDMPLSQRTQASLSYSRHGTKARNIRPIQGNDTETEHEIEHVEGDVDTEDDDDDEDEHEERQGRYECKTGGKGGKRTIHVSRHRQDQSRMDTDFSEHEEVDATMAPISFNSQRTKSSKF